MRKQQTVRVEQPDNRQDTDAEARPASFVAIEAQLSEEQKAIVKHVAILWAATALKIARERGILK